MQLESIIGSQRAFVSQRRRNDRVDGFILLATSCDGTLATSATHTTVRVVCANTLAVAQFLQTHPQVAWVNYPGLPDNKYHALARKYLPKGASGLLNFGVKGSTQSGGARAGEKFIDAAEFMSHLANIGDAKTLIIHPASTTHRQMSDEEQLKAGVTPDMVRMSVGIESLDDILWDIDQALNASGKA